MDWRNSPISVLDRYNAHGLRAGVLRGIRELAPGAFSMGSRGLALLSLLAVASVQDTNLGGYLASCRNLLVNGLRQMEIFIARFLWMNL